MMNGTNKIFPLGIEIETGYPSVTARGRTISQDSFERQMQAWLNTNQIPWTAGYDGSAGLELRSGIITKPEELNHLARICSALRMEGCKIHQKCGVHVHVGFKQIGDLSAKYRLFRFVSVYEALIFDLLNPWPERQEYCKKLTEGHWTSFAAGQGFQWWLGTGAAPLGNASRYHWFNGAAMTKYGTVEFRLMNGSLNAEDIVGWASMLQCLFQAIGHHDVKLNWRDLDRSSNLANFIEDLRCDKIEFYGPLAKDWVYRKAAENQVTV